MKRKPQSLQMNFRLAPEILQALDEIAATGGISTQDVMRVVLATGIWRERKLMQRARRRKR